MKLHRRPQSVDLLIECLETRALLGGDHPSMSDFPDATEIVLTQIMPDAMFAEQEGEIEVVGDDDLFKFTAPYSSGTSIVVVQTVFPGLAPAIQLFDDTGTPLSSLHDGMYGGSAIFPIPLTYITQNETYYINVKAGVPDTEYEPDVVGTYVIHIMMVIPSESQAAPTDERPTQTPTGQFNSDAAVHGKAREIVDGYTFDPIVYGDAPAAVIDPVEHHPLTSVALGVSSLIPATFVTPASTPGGDFSLARVGALPGAVTQQASATLRADRPARSSLTLELFDSSWDTSALATIN